MRVWTIGLVGSLAVGLIAGVAAAPQLTAPAPLVDVSADLVREPALQYFTKPTTDAIVKLNAELQRGAVKLTFDDTQGYLPAILDALHVPSESQMLIFSKTSVQSRYITPRNPRAIYFNDAVTVGYIPGAEYLEFAVEDPRQGVIFYTLDQRRAEQPIVERRDFCLSCHNANATLDVPGMLVRSVAATVTGNTAPRLANFVSDHRTPFVERWAGHYVTGSHGAMTHLGNTTYARSSDPDSTAASETMNVTSVKDRFEADRYVSPHSDIVALLVFDHQMRMTNLLTRIGWDTRVALQAKRPDVAEIIDRAAAEVVDYLLFIDEAPLADRVAGTSGFDQKFAALGPTDRRGRSLRQLDLTTRLLRYPCSYMIYAESFEALPSEARDAIYHRLWQVLSGREQSARYARLAAADRRAITEILRDTKTNLPAYFRPSSN
jgi:hypothetical protein